MHDRSHLILSAVPLGMEAVAATEMRAFGWNVTRMSPNEGTLEWTGSLEDLQRAHLELRCTERMSVEVGRVRAHHFAEFRRKASQLPWEEWLDPDRPLILRVSSRASRLYHERGLAERLQGAIADRLGAEPPLAEAATLDDYDAGSQLILARMFHDECTLRVDASGPRLHRRGYRLASAKAPLRETLAACVLAWSGWHPGAALLDPFCGSGTFPIEAAQRAAGIAPGARRRFAFERWPGFDSPGWEILRAAAGSRHDTVEIPIVGSDRDAGAIEASTQNAERAGASAATSFARASVSEFEPPEGEPGWIVTNPPYGQRVEGGDDLRNLFARFGDVLRQRFEGWRVVALAGHPAFASSTGLRWNEGPTINNGGTRVPVLRCNL